MVKYIQYQISLFRWLTYIQVCRFYIVENSSTHVLSIRKAGKFWIFIYYFVWINSIIKGIYLFLTYQGWLKPVEFLDKMSIWVYFLIVLEIVSEGYIFWKRTPLCEIILASWKLQREIYMKLNRPVGLSERIHASDKSLVHIHAVIAVVGCSSILVQYYPAPEYALYTYAIFPFRNSFLKMIFAAHEVLFIWHAWVNVASSNLLCEIFSVSATQQLLELAKIAESLYQPLSSTEREKIATKSLATSTSTSITPPSSSKKDVLTSPSPPKVRQSSPKSGVISKKKTLNLQPKEPTELFAYDIETLLFDYKKLSLASNEFNNWAGKWMGGSVGALYLQFVMDVFIMIQLMKVPGMDLITVFFYFQDAAVGMFVMFRLLILISRVWPASNEFLHQIKTYLRVDMPSKRRKYLIKYQNTFKPISAKLAGNVITPESVPHGIHALINYYISAAMWQTPVES